MNKNCVSIVLFYDSEGKVLIQDRKEISRFLGFTKNIMMF
jgi:hypothetical protein